MNQIVVIIGGSGFIGTRLVSRLLDKQQLSTRIFDKSPRGIFNKIESQGDVRSLSDLNEFIPDGAVIINLAAEHRDDVRPLSLYEEVNVKGARNICTIARDKNVKKIIYTSSVAVYGFAPVGTDETGRISPFNEYGRTKYEAEQIFREWQAEIPNERTLVIIRPTVVFGEKNRGNVYNLLKQIASKRFFMVGVGNNRKSIAYVENVAAFIEYCINYKAGMYLFNYIDKPDFTMNGLVSKVNHIIGRPESVPFRIPFIFGFFIGKFFDFIGFILNKRLAISSIRVKKFCANSVFNSSIDQTGFIPPVSIEEALAQTVRYEFLELNDKTGVFYSE